MRAQSSIYCRRAALAAFEQGLIVQQCASRPDDVIVNKTDNKKS
jgi:hypothetical protein